MYSKHDVLEVSEILSAQDEELEETGGGVSVDLDVIIMLHTGGISGISLLGTWTMGKFVLIGAISSSKTEETQL